MVINLAIQNSLFVLTFKSIALPKKIKLSFIKVIKMQFLENLAPVFVTFRFVTVVENMFGVLSFKKVKF